MTHPGDPEQMDDIITHSPEQFSAGLDAAANLHLPAGPFARVVVAGMGGSWMAAQLVSDAGLSTLPFMIHRNYGIPSFSDGKTLVIASSFSGNTEETLSAYDAAKAAGYSLIGMAAGGELEKKCMDDGVPFAKIPANPPTMQPRSATGYGVGILAQLLANAGLAAPNAVETIGNLKAFLEGFMDTARTRGEALVPDLLQKTPVIYASDKLQTVARIWKIKVNENAKTPAFWNVFPELNHNELIGWTSPHGAFHVLMLRDPEAHPRVLKRMEITAELLQKHGTSVTVVPIEGSTQTEKIFSTLLMGDWMSYRLALELGVDPSPVPMVEDLKHRLRE